MDSPWKQKPPYDVRPYKRKIDVQLTDHATGRVRIKTILLERDDLEHYKDFIKVECVEAVEMLFGGLFDEQT